MPGSLNRITNLVNTNKRHWVIKGQIILRQSTQVKQKRVKVTYTDWRDPRTLHGGGRATLARWSVGELFQTQVQAHLGQGQSEAPEGHTWALQRAGASGHGVCWAPAPEIVVRVKFQVWVFFLIKTASSELWLHCFFFHLKCDFQGKIYSVKCTDHKCTLWWAFNKCMHLCNQQPNQNLEHFHAACRRRKTAFKIWLFYT